MNWKPIYILATILAVVAVVVIYEFVQAMRNK